MRSLHKFVALSVVSASLASGAAADPFKISAQDQVKLGDRAAADVRKNEKVLPDSDPRTVLIRRIGQKYLDLYAADDKTIKNPKPFKYSFEVIDSKEVNAFCLPGGHTFFYTGLLDRLTTEDQVAAVLGHELTHAREEHFASDYAAAQRREIGLTAILIAVNANSNLVNLAAITNDAIIGTKFSRNSENRADKGGFSLMVRAGYNPQGMVEVFETLNKAAGSGAPPEFLSTHPSDKNRIKNVQAMIQKEVKAGKSFQAQIPLPSLPKTTPDKKKS